MKRTLKIYKTLLKLNYLRAITYRINFLNGLISSMLWSIFSVITIYALTSKTSHVFGWSREELFVLIGVTNIMVGGIYRTFFAKNFDQFAQIIQRGELDGVLLKPLNSQLFLSFQYISLYGMLRIFLAFIFTYIMLQYAHSSLDIFSVLQFFVLALFGLITLYSMWYLLLTLLIWFPDLYNLIETLYTVDTLTRYPPQILGQLRYAIFYIFIPFTLVVSTPTKALLHKLTALDAVILISLGCGLLFASHLFWKFALRSYTSASG